MGGFVITTSIIYFFCSAAIGYLILRVIAAIDVYFFDVVFVVFQRTPITTSIVQGKGLTYRA